MADNRTTQLFGLELSGELPADAVPTAAVVVVEYIDAEDSRRYLRLLSSEMPLWARLGMLRVVCHSDERDAAEAFEADDG